MKNLYLSLLAAQTKMGGVGKDAKNTFANYDYVSAETMITECRKALHKAGLLFYRVNWTLNMETMVVGSKYRLIHPESGESIDLLNDMVVPPHQKQVDKAALAALTTGMNYTLRDLLLIPRCENEQPEVDNLPAAKKKKVMPKITIPKKSSSEKALPEGSPGLVAAMGFVFGMKDDPAEYEAALIRHASEKYEKEFSSVESLPDEYMIRVLEAHRVDYKLTPAGETPALTGA